MSLAHTLMARERQFWEASSAGDSKKVRDCMTDDALAVGTFGVLDKNATAQAADGQRPFEFWRVDGSPRVLQLTTACAVVVYQATAKREGGVVFTAMMSSTYVRLDGDWKMAFHHQTRLAAEQEERQVSPTARREQNKSGQVVRIPARR